MWRTGRIAIIAAVTLAGAFWLWMVWPRPVIVVTTPTSETVPAWYMMTAFPVLGMLMADLWPLVRHWDRGLRAMELGAQIALLVALSSGRLAIRLPIGGHALLFAYFLTRRLLQRRRSTGADQVELAAAAVFAVVTAHTKLVWWADPITLGLGSALGVGMAVLGHLIVERLDR